MINRFFKKKKSTESYQEPSEEFMRAICRVGTIEADCEFCGRTHFSAIGDYGDENELSELLRKAKKNPDQYIPCDNSSIDFGTFLGKQVVWGCECNPNLKKYEDFIWDHRYMIIEYLQNRSRAEAETANLQKEFLEMFMPTSAHRPVRRG